MGCPPAGSLPDPGIEPLSPALAGILSTMEPPRKPTDDFWLLVNKSVNNQGESILLYFEAQTPSNTLGLIYKFKFNEKLNETANT